MAEEIPRREVDVAVVGAGLAGLTAARELRKRGVSVCVVEARDRHDGKSMAVARAHPEVERTVDDGS